MRILKAHAYGNDFLLAPAEEARGDASSLARRMCDRHLGAGADGLILFRLRDRAATMTLFNADGSPSELSGNGLRCLAALIVHQQRVSAGAVLTIDTGAGVKTLDLMSVDGSRYTLRAALGPPTDLRQQRIDVE